MRIPDDFLSYAVGKRTLEIAAHYGIGEDTARRWCKPNGITPKKMRSNEKRTIMQHDSLGRILFCLSCERENCNGSCVDVLEIE